METHIMETITFNKNYTKLPAGIKTATLIACEPVRLQEQERHFILYDTQYSKKLGFYAEPATQYHNGEDGYYLCLVLKSDTGAIFTTLRKDNFENREKYMMQPCLDCCKNDDWIPRYNNEFQIIIKEG